MSKSVHRKHSSKKKLRHPFPAPTKKCKGDRVKEEDVILKRGKGSPKSGGMPNGFFWHIYHKEERAGKVYINYDKNNKYAEIQIFINQKSQGKGIGCVAYKKACELSQYEVVYATIKKSNIASLKAAFAAGFRIIPSKSNQIQMMWSNIHFTIEAFESLPQKLPKSIYIDFLLFLANLKPSLRIRVSEEENKNALNEWCKTNNFYLLFGKDNYIFIGKNKTIIKKLEETDTSTSPHEYKLGCLLGYPDCCCKKIADISEKNIDKYEEELIKNSSNFQGAFELINPKGYKKGYALISHIPCSYECKASLLIAQKTLYIVAQNNDRKNFLPWINAWKKYVLIKY